MLKLTGVVPHVLSFIIPLLATLFLEVVGAIPAPLAEIVAHDSKLPVPSGFRVVYIHGRS